MSERKVVCENCDTEIEYYGGCVICPNCGWRDCNPVVENASS